MITAQPYWRSIWNYEYNGQLILGSPLSSERYETFFDSLEILFSQNRFEFHEE